jgi:protein-tyrosine phosphatase
VGFIDLHFHILPGVDDGAKDMMMAVEMARLALEDGVETIVATPHPNDSGIGSPSVTLEAIARLRLALQEHNLADLKVLPGAECFFSPETVEHLKHGQLLTINQTRYVLVEFHHVIAPVNIENALFRLRSNGYVPVIAHPERYKYVQTNLEWLAKLVKQGCLVQLTAGAFYGRFGKNCQKSAEQILSNNLAHLVASDAHNTQIRAPGIELARSRIERLSSTLHFQQLSREIPAQILANCEYERLVAGLTPVKNFWKFW